MREEMNRPDISPRVLPTLLFVAVFIGLGSAPLAADLQIEADRWRSVFAEGRERTVLSGNARVVSDRIDVQADEIELYGTDYRYVRASGNLRIVELERDLVLTGGSLFVDRDRDLIRVEGSAEMEDRENEMIVRGGFIEYQGERELTIVQIGVRILREDLVARAEFARYRRDDEVLELSGLPRIVWKDDEYRAARILVDLAADEISLRGEVRAELRTTEPEEDAESDEPAPDDEPSPDADAPANDGSEPEETNADS